MNKLIYSVLAAALGSSLVFAQMMGGGAGNNATTTPGSGMTSGSGTASGTYLDMFSTMGGMTGMGSGMGVGMTDDLAVDTDGTAYVIRAIQSVPIPGMGAPISVWQYELVAISPVDGGVKWRLPIPGGRISHPKLAKNNQIFLTVDNYQMFSANYKAGGSMMTGTDAQENDGQLVIVTHSDRVATILKTVQTTSDVLSAPRIVTDASGNYSVYVLGYDMMSWTQTSANTGGSFVPGNKILLAFRPDGTLKFSTPLGQTSMMP
ncbi:hypothetical protein EG829_28865 [bacterium]|nr:hypothetical protein [bacterium]